MSTDTYSRKEMHDALDAVLNKGVEQKPFLSESDPLPLFDPAPAPPKPKPKPRTAQQGNIYATIPRKTCAAEVYKKLKTFHYFIIGAMVCFGFSLIASVGGFIYLGVLVGAALIAGALLLRMNLAEMNRIKQSYNL